MRAHPEAGIKSKANPEQVVFGGPGDVMDPKRVLEGVLGGWRRRNGET